LGITEWPGGAVGFSNLKLGTPVLKAVFRGAAYVPLGPVTGRVPPEATLPWGSRLCLRAGTAVGLIVTGPAYVRKGQWALEVVEAFEGKGAELRAERHARQLLKEGNGPRESVRNQ
jgi:hypothetical protein